MTMQILVITASGFYLSTAESLWLLLVLLWLFSWTCSILFGFVAIFACSLRKQKGRRLRRIWAVANLVLSAGAISAFAVMGELVDSGVLYAGHASITVACILGIPTLMRQEPEIEGP